MSWAIFQIERHGEIVGVHVAPAADDGTLDVGHSLSLECECVPKEEVTEEGLLLVKHSQFAWR